MNTSTVGHRYATCLVGALLLLACSGTPRANTAPTDARSVVGPPRGAVMVVGGGSIGPEIYSRFIELAGGPEALIVDVPTAGGDSVYPPDWRGANGLKAAGAKNVVVLHTIDRNVADSDSFIAPLKRAGAVWFEGGRQYRLVDAYGGTQAEREFRNVLERGGIVGGSSAGASILGSYMVRGAPSNNNGIIMYPGYEAGFGYLRGVGIDQHVVARMRLRDLADSLMPKYPGLLGISEDEGTAWLVRGDDAEIIGRNKAFVYGGNDPNDARRPFLTLRPGDRYNLAARRVTHRAIDDSPLTMAFIDSLFRDFSKPGAPAATVLVAQRNHILVNAAYGRPDTNSKYMPLTTLPNFPLGALSEVLTATSGRMTDSVTRGSKGYGQLLARRAFTPLGMHHTVATDDGQVASSVDELYRWDQGLYLAAASSSGNAMRASGVSAWQADSVHHVVRWNAFGTSDGARHVFMRIPDRRIAVIVLTTGTTDVQPIAERIVDRLLATGGVTR